MLPNSLIFISRHMHNSYKIMFRPIQTELHYFGKQNRDISRLANNYYDGACIFFSISLLTCCLQEHAFFSQLV
jgi:hypothetical protein